MTDNWKTQFDLVIHGAQNIKETCLNRGDEKFAPWHEKARNTIAQYSPKKLPTFDEIRFASDFFLSKSREEQEEINDRIALLSDIDLFLKITETIAHDLRKKNRQFVKLEEIEAEPQAAQGSVAVKGGKPAASDGLKKSRECVKALSLSRHDEEEVLREIDRVEHELGKPRPDWDLIKRSIKFFLDFDRQLAQEIIPPILSLLPKP